MVNEFNAFMCSSMEQLHIIYSSSDARNIMYQYLTSSICICLKEIKVIDHKYCMGTLFRYTDRLSGIEPKMTKNMKKKY